jgi:N-methylhydantoinase B
MALASEPVRARAPSALGAQDASRFIELAAIPDHVPPFPLPGGGAIDPVTFSVVGGALFAICEEMDLTLRNASLSPIINVGKDFSCALFTADGRLFAQACNCPGHVGSMHLAVFGCFERFGASGIAPGDVFMLNDPYRGGTHLPDITIITPIFDRGELIAFAGNRAHHSDVGGSVPGSFPISTEIFEEGLRIPPVRCRQRGERVDAVFELLLANVRTPREVEGDLDAQLAANEAGARGLARVIDQFGRDVVLGAIGDYLDHSERALRAGLDLPPGPHRAEDWIDGDGHSSERRRIAVEITIRDTDVYVDFTGTAEQARGPINSVLGTTVSMVVTTLLALTDPTIMPNHGFYRPIHVCAPEGTLVNPRFPAPAVGFPDVCNRVVDVLMQALTPALPERAIAATSGTSTNSFFGGTHPATGHPYVWYSINSQGGWGGRGGADGWHDTCFVEANGWDIPIETIEYRYPWRVLEYGLRRDGAGAGRWRGGEGSRFAITPLDHESVFSLNGDRAATRPYGLFGGQPGASARCTIQRRDGAVERIAPATMKAQRIEVRPGDVVVIEGTSGGGYGNPLERPAALVARDVLDGLLSAQRARTDYGVIVDAAGAIDLDATSALRARLSAHFEALAERLPVIDRDGYSLLESESESEVPG